MPKWLAKNSPQAEDIGQRDHKQAESASAVAPPAVQNAGGIGIDQYGEAVPKSVGIVINKNRALVANAAAENTTQAKQGATAAYFAAFSSTIADDLAVRTENSFQKRN
jgi:hypothetical protein